MLRQASLLTQRSAFAASRVAHPALLSPAGRRLNSTAPKSKKDWPEDGLVGPYPNLPYEYYNQRPQDVKWDDQQGRRNLGEPLHHRFDLIDVWSPDHFEQLPDRYAWKYNAVFVSIIAGFSLLCWYNWEEPQFVRREYPFEGLNKALGGDAQSKELFAAREDKDN